MLQMARLSESNSNWLEALQTITMQVTGIAVHLAALKMLPLVHMTLSNTGSDPVQLVCSLTFLCYLFTNIVVLSECV